MTTAKEFKDMLDDLGLGFASDRNMQMGIFEQMLLTILGHLEGRQ